MIELALILAINLGGLSFAVLLARWLSGRDAGTAEMRRVAAAVSRATDAFLWREFRLIALSVVLGSALIFAGHACLLRLQKPFGSMETAFWTTAGLALGAVLAGAVGYVGGRLGSLGSVRMLSAARQSLDRALTISMRASGATGLLVETLSVLGACSLFGLVYALKGGFASTTERGPLALQAAMSLPGFAFGAVISALVIQRGGSIFHVGADVGGDVAGERDAGLDHDDARNPAAVTDLVGDHVGPAAARACDLFVSAAVANVAGLLIGAGVQLANAEKPWSGPLALLVLPATIRAFGVIACGVGLMVARAGDDDNPSGALARGHLAATVVALAGLGGACFWLVTAYWLYLFAAGACGALTAILVAYTAPYRASKRSDPLRDVLAALRGADAIAVAHALGHGLKAALLPVLGVGAGMAAAYQLGAATGLAGGGLLGSLMAVTAILATASYVLAVGNFAAMADNARGVAGMSPGIDTKQRATRLDDAGFVAASGAQPYLIVVSCLTALVAAAAVPILGGRGASFAGIDLSKPIVAWSGALGGAFVLAYAGSTLSGASQAARGIALEVQRQLAGFPRENGVAQVPRDYIPSYRTCVDLGTRLALERMLAPIAIALLVPALLGIALRLMYRSFDPGLWAEGLVSFVVVASVTGLAAALSVDAARATLGAARRTGPPRGSNAGFDASVTGDAVADLIGNSAGPAANLVVKAAAVSSLVVTSFLT